MRPSRSQHAHLGGMLSHSLGQFLHNAGIDIEQVVTGHAGLAGHAGRDDDEVCALQSLPKLLLAIMPGNLRRAMCSICCMLNSLSGQLEGGRVDDGRC